MRSAGTGAVVPPGDVRYARAFDLYDDNGTRVGTSSYRLRFGDQLPPDGQGAVINVSVGPLEYSDGSSAIVQGHEHEVFGKNDVLKREFFKTVCGGRK